VTTKGIWGFGATALAALAAFCIWQHGPTIAASEASVGSNTQTSAELKMAQAETNSKNRALPPAVTGPSAENIATMPKGAAVPSATPPSVSMPVAPAKVEAPKIEPPPKVAPPVAPTVQAPAPDAVAKPEVAFPKVNIAPVAPLAKASKPKSAARVQRASFSHAKLTNSGCEVKGSAAVLKSVCFGFNSARLSAASKAKLAALVPSLKASDKQYELSGFADAVGSKVYNADLSARRSQAVLKYLQTKGVDAGKVVVRSYGSDEAEKVRLGKNQRERRVDVRVL
jgi:outer membrane protein OmpA-like peptidoglycan-associated protein